MTHAGRFRHRVTIEEATDIQDATTGEVVPSWAAVFSNVPAEIEPLSVKEFIGAQQVQSEIAVRITIRWRPGLNAKQRIRHGTTIYLPAGMLADKKSGQDYVTIPCSAGVSEGE